MNKIGNTEEDAENTKKIATKDIEDFNSMSNEQDVVYLKKRFDTTVDENGNTVYTMFCRCSHDHISLQ